MSPKALPIAIILPHSGSIIPPEVRASLALEERDLFNEADIYTEYLFDFRDRVTHWLRFPYARAVIDVNRPNDPTLTRPGDGIVKHRTSYGIDTYAPGQAPDTSLQQHLINRYWRPWHQQLVAIATNPHIKLVIDAHSMAATGPSQYDDPGNVRPCVCLCNLGDGNARREVKRNRLSLEPEMLFLFKERLEGELADITSVAPMKKEVTINHPYWGGWDVWAGSGKQQPWLMIEISRALYIGNQNGNSPIAEPNMNLISPLREKLWTTICSLYEHIITGSQD